MKRLAVIAAAALLLTACSHGPKQGEVIGRDHSAAYTYVQMQPIYTTRCSGTPLVCVQVQAGVIPIIINEPERWRLKLKDCSASPCKTGWVDVSVTQFDTVATGSFFKAAS